MLSVNFLRENHLQFDDNMAYSEDMVLLLEILSAASVLVNIPALTYCYRRGNADAATAMNSTAKRSRYGKSQVLAIHKIAELSACNSRWKKIDPEKIIQFTTRQYGFLKTEEFVANPGEWKEYYRKIRKIYRSSPLYMIQKKFVYPAEISFFAYSWIKKKHFGKTLNNILGRMVTF